MGCCALDIWQLFMVSLPGVLAVGSLLALWFCGLSWGLFCLDLSIWVVCFVFVCCALPGIVCCCC